MLTVQTLEFTASFTMQITNVRKVYTKLLRVHRKMAILYTDTERRTGDDYTDNTIQHKFCL